MGSGSWDPTTYSSSSSAKAAAGHSAFHYSDDVLASRPRSTWEVHDRLDPKKVAGDESPFAGKVMRESRDSDEHPETVAIAVLFDVTGSMGGVPRILQEKLPKLHGLIQRKGYVEHPQVLFGAIGDATCDRIPLQVGQFESDNRMDEDLEAIVLEAGGGGGNHESYELAAYFLARHTDLDCVAKRGKRGYAFLIGDERSYGRVRAGQVANLIGDHLQDDLPTEEVFAELGEKYEIFYLFAPSGSYHPDAVIADTTPDPLAVGWRSLLGQNAVVLDRADSVCETIALMIGLSEGAIDLDEGIDHLREMGTAEETVESTSKALAEVASGKGKAIAATGGDVDVEGEDGIEAV